MESNRDRKRDTSSQCATKREPSVIPVEADRSSASFSHRLGWWPLAAIDAAAVGV